MTIAFILLLNTVIIVSSITILFQCSTAKRSNSQRAKSRKSSKSRRSRKSGSRKSSRSSKSSRKSSKSSKSSGSVKSKKLKKNPKGNSNKKVTAAILADRKAARDAINPSLEDHQSGIVTSKRDNCSSSKISYSNVRVIPHEISFRPIGGLKHVRVKNSTGKRVAFMVKCSDNMLFSINPVYGIIDSEKDAQINILRENGEPKNDKLVIITAVHPDPKMTAEQTFTNIHNSNSHNYNINVVPLLTQ